MTSIIIPAYNAEKYLQAAIESVISQSDSDWELILVDDGSTDSTPEICDKAAKANKKIKTIHRKNGGLSAARNTGLDAATGEFIAFLDADDLLAPDFLRLLSDALKNTDASFAATPFVRFTKSSPIINNYSERKSSNYLTIKVEDSIRQSLYQTRLHSAPYVLDHSAWGKLYRKELWDNVRFTEGIWYEDLDIFTRLWRNAQLVAFVPVPLMFYRSHAESFTNNFSMRRLDVLDVTDRMVENISAFYGSKSDPRHSELITAARTRRFAAHYNILLLLLRNGNPAPEALDRCKKVIRNERGMVLRNKDARLKDRLGALLSYLIML